MLGFLASSDSSGGGAAVFIVFFLVAVLVIIGWWKIFEKADEAGWKALIPIYNAIVLLRIAGKPWWWILLLLIPFVNLVVLIIWYVELARSFGKGAGFAIGMVFLPFIFLLILAFGDSKYVGPGGQPAGGSMAPPPPPPAPAG